MESVPFFETLLLSFETTKKITILKKIIVFRSFLKTFNNPKLRGLLKIKMTVPLTSKV